MVMLVVYKLVRVCYVSLLKVNDLCLKSAMLVLELGNYFSVTVEKIDTYIILMQEKRAILKILLNNC